MTYYITSHHISAGGKENITYGMQKELKVGIHKGDTQQYNNRDTFDGS